MLASLYSSVCSPHGTNCELFDIPNLQTPMRLLVRLFPVHGIRPFAILKTSSCQLTTCPDVAYEQQAAHPTYIVSHQQSHQSPTQFVDPPPTVNVSNKLSCASSAGGDSSSSTLSSLSTPDTSPLPTSYIPLHPHSLTPLTSVAPTVCGLHNEIPVSQISDTKVHCASDFCNTRVQKPWS
jgi:hypothetical protein